MTHVWITFTARWKTGVYFQRDWYITLISMEVSYMKRAVSISIGSSKRDKMLEIELLGETVQRP